MTALHWAAQRDEVEAAALLVGGGANPKAVTRYGVTPLALACLTGSPRMIDVLLKAGADVNAASPEGRNPADDCGSRRQGRRAEVAAGTWRRRQRAGKLEKAVGADVGGR